MASYIDKKMRKGARVIPSQAIEKRYLLRLESVCGAMFAAENASVRRASVKAIVKSQATSIATEFVKECVYNSSVNSRKAVSRLAKRGSKPDYYGDTPQLARAELALLKENIELIKSIPDKYYEKVDKARREFSGEALERRLLDIRRITLNRAKLIARDQNNKAAEGLALRRFKDNGIQYVMWRHSYASAVPRDYHKRKWDGHSGIRNGKPNGLNGFVFRIDKPPVIDLKTGERGFPSQLINCRCFLIPVQFNSRTLYK